METPQKMKSGSAFWLSNSTSGDIFKGTQNTNLKEHKHPYVHCSIIYNHQEMEAAQCPSVDESVGHLHNGILLSCKKKKILPFVTICVDLENIMLSETSQSVNDKYHMISLICGIKWTNWINEENGDRLIDGEQADS